MITTLLTMAAKFAGPLAAKQITRQQTFIQLLAKLGLKPQPALGADFATIYTYTLVEYGANQVGILNQEDLQTVLELLHQDEIKQAFREAFDRDRPQILVNVVAKQRNKIENYELDKNIRDRRINLLPELANFSNIFIKVIDRTRNPAEVRRDRKLDRLQAELNSLPEKISQNLLSLPAGDRSSFADSNFTQQLHNWFEALYDFEIDDVWGDDYFEWIIQVPARRRYDRILVRGIEGEANINDLKALEESVKKYNTDEGWLVAPSRVSQAVRDAVEGDRRCRSCHIYLPIVLLYFRYIPR